MNSQTIRPSIEQIVAGTKKHSEGVAAASSASCSAETLEILQGVLHKLMIAQGVLSNLVESDSLKNAGLAFSIHEIDENVREAREMVRSIVPLTPGGHGQ